MEYRAALRAGSCFSLERLLPTCWATILLCCACSSTGSNAKPGASGGSAGSGGQLTAEAGAGNPESQGGAGGAPDGSSEAGQAGENEPAGAGGTRSAAGGSSANGGKSSGGGGKGAAGSGSAPVGSCSNADSECGGNLTGSWAVELTCVDVRTVASGPFAGCEGITYRLATMADLTFAGDGSYQETTTATAFSGVFNVPKACAQDGSCANVAADLDVENASTETKADVCEVTGSLPNTPDTDSGTYAVNGNTLIVDGKADRPMTFCVKGNTLVFTSVQERQVVVQTLTRK